jgi:hypothetical protein
MGELSWMDRLFHMKDNAAHIDFVKFFDLEHTCVIGNPTAHLWRCCICSALQVRAAATD